MSPLPLSLALYRSATSALEPLAPRLLARRARRGKEDPARIGERLGRSPLERPRGKLVWLHGASVGEGLSLLPLVDAIAAARPDLAMLITSGTVTSAALLGRRLPAAARHQFAPVDAPRAAAAFLDHWRPDLGVLVESELWPNLILASQDRGVPLALVSARLSQASLSGWAKAPAAARALLSGFQLVMAQDDATAGRLAALGARDDGRMNLKLIGAPLPAEETALAAIRTAAAGRPVLLAASTHAGEEEPVLEAFTGLATLPQRPLLVLVPRHPARGGEVEVLAERVGFTVRRQGAGQRFDGQSQVYVADALGELGLWFRTASSVLVGGGWAPGVGGHNPLEPARLGAPLISGPGVANWSGVYADLLAEDAIQIVTGAPSLAGAFAADLADPDAAAARAARAFRVAEQGAQSLEAATAKLLALLP
jgi:3-deoxy-D-manno-octulosonic-acid transferase